MNLTKCVRIMFQAKNSSSIMYGQGAFRIEGQAEVSGQFLVQKANSMRDLDRNKYLFKIFIRDFPPKTLRNS